MRKAVFAGAVALAMMGPLFVSEKGIGPVSASAQEVIVTTLDEMEQRARVEGGAKILLGLLKARFGSVPAKVSAQIHAADEETLSRWSLRVLTAPSLSEVFAERNGKSSPGRRPVARKPARR